jgi:hypothetical protein
MLKTKRYYEGVLRAYYYSYYGMYEEDTEFYVNPALNKWKFYIPPLDVIVTLTCDDEGEVTEEHEVPGGARL